jgi:hypothetical protein
MPAADLLCRASPFADLRVAKLVALTICLGRCAFAQGMILCPQGFQCAVGGRP